MDQPLSRARMASYGLAAFGLFAMARWDLGPSLLAALFAYMILDQTDRRLRDAGAGPLLARGAAVAIFAVLAGLLAAIFAAFIRIGLARLPQLLDRLLPRLDELGNGLGMELPVGSAEELKNFILDSAKENARSITMTSGLLTRGFFRILVGISAAAALFLAPGGAPETGGNFHGALAREVWERVTRFMASFELVLGAQVIIAAVNTGVTTVFLFAAHIPFRTFLVLATFVCGMIPIVGTVVSSALIVAAALTRSTHLAVVALIVLIILHKAQYFLNGRIVGARIDMPMWTVLSALMAGEAVMGVPGVILAPTLLHYAREEMRQIPTP